MKKLVYPLAAFCALAVGIASCKKDAQTPQGQISSDKLSAIEQMGFSTYGIQKTATGYLVEGDINLTDKEVSDKVTSPNLIIANEEQYNTFNLVSITKHPTIKVALNNTSGKDNNSFSAALDEAIKRYNDQALHIAFTRVDPSQSPDITVVAFYQVSNTLGSSGFPTSTGDPYNQIQMNTYWYTDGTDATNVNYIGTIMAHEMGHCIGFRHTDYMNRAYSCGGRKQNEGQSTTGVGAVWIPGTPTGGDPNSWMLACVGSNVNRPFNSNDIIALDYLYKK